MALSTRLPMIVIKWVTVILSGSGSTAELSSIVKLTFFSEAFANFPSSTACRLLSLICSNRM
ncbi:Uncharacterised protein [Mycobacteroides abscessus subsp. abscessus]|nr:Uncharacterised protein [Mycobacteroides abscessus subsp. abscessus]